MRVRWMKNIGGHKVGDESDMPDKQAIPLCRDKVCCTVEQKPATETRPAEKKKGRRGRAVTISGTDSIDDLTSEVANTPEAPAEE